MELEEHVVGCPDRYHIRLCECVALEDGKVEPHWFRWGS